MTGDISSIRWRPFELDLIDSFSAGWDVVSTKRGVVIQLTDRSGIVGLAEAAPMPGYVNTITAEDVLDQLRGLDSSSFTFTMLNPARPGAHLVWNACLMALEDMRSRKMGVPLHASFQGTSGSQRLLVNGLIDSSDVDGTVRQAHELQVKGYKYVKLKIGLLDQQSDMERIRGINEACPELVLRLDANGKLSISEARDFIQQVQKFNIELVEQPTEPADISALGTVTRESSIPIAADESVYQDAGTLRELVTGHKANILVLKPSLIGSISTTIGIARWAQSHGVSSFITSMFESAIGLMTAAHAASLLPVQLAHGLGTGEWIKSDIAETPVPDQGQLILPTESGLGVEIDCKALERVATGPWQEIYYA